MRAVRRRYSAAGYPPSAAGRSPPQRSLSAGLPRRSAVERGGSRAIEVSYGGATLVPRLEDERLAQEIGELILDWTERALAAVLEVYYLPYISPISPLYLPCICRARPRHAPGMPPQALLPYPYPYA